MTAIPSLPTFDDLQPARHLCAFYETTAELQALFVTWLRQGLELNQKCLYLAESGESLTAWTRAQPQGLDLGPASARGQLARLDADEVCLHDRLFDPEAMLGRLQAECERALAAGYSGLRTFREMSWVLRNRSGAERLAEHEARLNRFLPGQPVLTVCAYDRRQFGAEVLLDILHTHPRVAVGAEIYDNIYYCPPDEFLRPRPAEEILSGQLRRLAGRKQVEEALREGEARYRRLIESFTDYIYTVHVVEGQAAETRHGPGCVAITGYTAEEFAADPYLWFRMVVPEDQTKVLAQVQQVLAGRDFASLEHRLVRRDGAVRWVRNTPVPHRDPQGRLLSYDGLIQDVTDRKLAEEALRTTRDQLVTITDNIPILIAHFSADRRYRYANEIHARFVGVAKADIAGRHVRDIIGEEGYANASPHIERVLAGEAAAFENTVLNAEGELRTTSVQYTPERDERGQVIGYFTLIQDITGRKQAEEALRRSDERFSKAFRVSPIGMNLARFADRRIVDINQADLEIFGFTREEVIGKTAQELGMIILASEWDNVYQNLEQTGSLRRAERPLHRKDGTLRDVLISAELIDINNEKHALWLHQDITEQKQAESKIRQLNAELEQRVAARTAELSARSAELQQANAELLRANRLKDEFLANMSHELRTPLTAILGLTEALQMDNYGPLLEKQLQMLEVIHQSGEHLLALITDILDLSKIEAGKGELRLAPTATQDVCEASLQFIRQAAQKKKVRVMFTPDPQVRLIQADARRLKQMLVNLLNNAIKFTPADGQVGLEVAGDAARREVHFAVWDTGIGLSPEEQASLFQPFVQVDGSLTRKYEGAGLGLALTRRLAEMHGGRVRVESQGADQGSRFTLTLPWHPAETPPRLPADKAPATLTLPSGRPPVILLADDNEATLTAVGDFLQSLSASVITAQTGQQALAQAQATQPDLILMDIQMPGLNGLEAIRRLKAAPDTARIPIIALTALAMSGDRDRCLEAGADDYLSKPVRLVELTHAITRLLAP